MLVSDINNSINTWTEWAKGTGNFDIAIFKIWIQFEKFISDLFVLYAIGEKSEKDYVPERTLCFQEEEQLNVFLRGTGPHIDYPQKIKLFSKHIFKDSPFEKIIFSDQKYSNIYAQLFAIRNYIAHESGDAKLKYIKSCLGNKPEDFKEPNEYLKFKNKGESLTNYSRYVTALEEIALLLVDPPIDN